MKQGHSTGAAVIAFCVSVLLFAQSARAAVTYYGGGWTNTGFGGPASGNAFAQFVENGTQVQLILDVQGMAYFPVFGTISPSVLELVGTRGADQSIAFDPIVGHPSYGNVTAAISSVGTVSMNWSSMPMSDSVTAHGPVTGVINPTALELDFDLQANTGIIAIFRGSIDMRNVPEPCLSLAAIPAFALTRRRRVFAGKATARSS